MENASSLAMGMLLSFTCSGEVDLDIGNYERFMNIELTFYHSLTSGKLYQRILKYGILAFLERSARVTTSEKPFKSSHTWSTKSRPGSGVSLKFPFQTITMRTRKSSSSKWAAPLAISSRRVTTKPSARCQTRMAKTKSDSYLSLKPR